MTKQENITKIDQLVVKFINTKDETELEQIVDQMVELSNSFQYEHKWRGPAMKIVTQHLAGMLLENISAIANGTIEPLTDGEVDEALTEFKSIAESTIDS